MLLLPLYVQAQVSKHEIGLGVGCWPGGISYIYDTERDKIHEWARRSGEPNFNESIPIFSADYAYNITSHWAVGGVFAVCHFKEEQSLYLGTNTSFVLMPQVRFTWKNFRHARLYSRVAGGMIADIVSVETENLIPNNYYSNKKALNFAAQLSPFGFDVGGKHVRFYGELGLGMQGFAIGGLRFMF